MKLIVRHEDIERYDRIDRLIEDIKSKKNSIQQDKDSMAKHKEWIAKDEKELVEMEKQLALLQGEESKGDNDKCPLGICDGSGKYEEWTAPDSSRIVKCGCYQESDMDDNSADEVDNHN